MTLKAYLVEMQKYSENIHFVFCLMALFMKYFVISLFRFGECSLGQTKIRMASWRRRSHTNWIWSNENINTNTSKQKKIETKEVKGIRVNLVGFQTPPTKMSYTTPHHIPKYEILQKKEKIVNYPFKATQKAKIFKSKQEMCDCVIPMHCYIGPVYCICKANYKPRVPG